MSCFLEWLGLNPNCKRMLDDETKIMAHQGSKLGNTAVPIFQQAVNKDPEWCIEARAQVTAALYAMLEAIVRFDSRLGNISYITTGQGKRTADTDAGRRKRVRKV